jgi:hypothetical protein
MSSLPRTKRAARALATAVTFGALVAGCSDPGLYLDRRDSIALSAGDAIAANKVTQMYDPWPARSGDTNIAFNGQKMQSAIERYRTNVVTQPIDPLMLQVANPSSTTTPTGGSQSPAPGGSTSTSNSSTTSVSNSAQ